MNNLEEFYQINGEQSFKFSNTVLLYSFKPLLHYSYKNYN